MADKLSRLTFSMAFIAGLVLAVIWYFTMYNDGTVLEQQILAAKKQMESDQKEVEFARQAIQESEHYKKTMEDLGTEMERVVQAIPSQLSTIELMKIVSREAKEVGAQINSLSAGLSNVSSQKKDPSVFYEPVSIEIDMTASYNQIMMFLSNLTRLDKIIISRKMNLNVSGGVKGSGVTNPSISMRATLQAYHYLATTDRPAGATKPAGGE